MTDARRAYELGMFRAFDQIRDFVLYYHLEVQPEAQEGFHKKLRRIWTREDGSRIWPDDEDPKDGTCDSCGYHGLVVTMWTSEHERYPFCWDCAIELEFKYDAMQYHELKAEAEGKEEMAVARTRPYILGRLRFLKDLRDLINLRIDELEAEISNEGNP